MVEPTSRGRPLLQIKKTKNTGKTFRVANGATVPNQGETEIIGTAISGTKMKVTAQVAKITKPLASANEMVDAMNLIIMHKDGGMVKKLTQEQLNRVLQGLQALEGSEVPIKREKGAFTIDIEVPESSIWKEPKKPVRNQQSSKMEVDFVSKNPFEEIAEKESPLMGFQRLFGTW